VRNNPSARPLEALHMQLAPLARRWLLARRAARCPMRNILLSVVIAAVLAYVLVALLR